MSAVPVAPSADRLLAAREGRLPAAALVLDDDAVARHLDRVAPEAGMRRVRARYARYKPGRSLLVAFTVRTDHGPGACYLRAHALDERDKLVGMARHARHPGPLGSGVHVDADAGLAVLAWPNDRRLRAVADLHGARRRARLLADAGWTRPVGAPTVLAYKPERRLVARLEGSDGGAVVARVGVPATEVARVLGALRAAGLAVPAPVGVAADAALLLTTWTDGEALPAGRLGAADAERLGGLLAALHAARVPTPPEPEDTRAATGAAAELLGALVPSLADRATALAARLDGRGPVNASALVHGDLSADQLLRRPGGELTLLDLDRARRGDPAEDLGSLAAALELAGAAPSDVARAVATVSAAHVRAGGPPIGDLDAAWALALLRRAPEPFRRREPCWERHAERLLARAEAVLGA